MCSSNQTKVRFSRQEHQRLHPQKVSRRPSITAAPVVDAPLERMMSPLFPLVAIPVFSVTDPLAPLTPALEEARRIDPLNVEVPKPLWSATLPPVAIALEPTLKENRPPTPLEPAPTLTATEPPLPDVEVLILTRPLGPSFDVPVPIMRPPLMPEASKLEVRAEKPIRCSTTNLSRWKCTHCLR